MELVRVSSKYVDIIAFSGLGLRKVYLEKAILKNPSSSSAPCEHKEINSVPVVQRCVPGSKQNKGYLPSLPFDFRPPDQTDGRLPTDSIKCVHYCSL